MGKIRLKDLARMMKRPEQDLLFMLKSIGVRVEGDDEIDSELIQAILQGKRLPQPREVILRDANADSPSPAQPAAPVKGPSPQRKPEPKQPLRHQNKRRSMIQRVEPKIRELEIKDKPEDAPIGAPLAATAPAAKVEAV
ncbi:MAG: translation initiation factor IF-2 N-terminal domain-containing protein, partial [Acidobacteriota bacterium]